MAVAPRRLTTKPPPPEQDVSLISPPDGRMAFVWWQWLIEFLRLNRYASPTTNRPPGLTTADIGFQMFDTTLGRPIWWNGTAWINAAGTVV
jgi:hypothetical protein